MSKKGFRDLFVWQKAMDYVMEVCRLSAKVVVVGWAKSSRPTNLCSGRLVGREDLAHPTSGRSFPTLPGGAGWGADEVLARSHEVARLINGLSNSLSSKLTPNH